MLEIVIAGRNAEQGGEAFLDALCAAADHNHALLSAKGVEHCFTLVEWNPVPERRLLADQVIERLRWWHRTIVVDREWHQALAAHPQIDVLECFARNAAIRRSTADAVLTMSADVWLSEELVSTLSERTFHHRVVYRAGEPGDPAALETNRPIDFLLLTRDAWMTLGGFNERIRFAEHHKHEEFCRHAAAEGFSFEVLGRIDHVARKPEDPQDALWGAASRYRNPLSWGLSAAIDEATSEHRVVVHHPSTHGPLLSIIVPSAAPGHQAATEETAPPLVSENLASLVNSALAAATGQFVVVTADRTLQAFGGSESLMAMLRNTTAGLIVPADALSRHPQLGPVPLPGAPYVMRRDLIDLFAEWDETVTDPALAFWLRAAERVDIATIGVEREQPHLPLPVSAGVQAETLSRRGEWIPRPVFDAVIREHLAASRAVHTILRDWLDSVAPDMDGLCAIVGPDWATPGLLELIQAQNRMLAGVFTTVGVEEGTWRWGQQLRPIKELTYTSATYILAGIDAGLMDRLASLGCKGTVHVVCPTSDIDLAVADSELDWLRRAQVRDLTANQISSIQGRLPLLGHLDPQRAWEHRYDAAQACERAKLPAAALELYREITAECSTDLALSLRAAFHTARLLIDRGALHQAAPLLAKILKHNPGHRAARELFDRITKQELSA